MLTAASDFVRPVPFLIPILAGLVILFLFRAFSWVGMCISSADIAVELEAAPVRVMISSRL